MEPIDLNDIVYCRERLAEAQAMARSARSREESELHAQTALLFQVRLELLKTSRV